jgi:hypothetical protein
MRITPKKKFQNLRKVLVVTDDVSLQITVQMDPSVAFPTESDEILFSVMAQLTSRRDVVNFQSHP